MIRNPPPWPNDCKCAVSITFDLDADSLIHLEHPSDSYRRVSTISTLRYGPEIAIERILKTYERLGLQQTFFIPGWCVRQYPDVVRRIVSGGHEIAHHGYLHENPIGLEPAAQADIIDRGIDAITDIAGVRPRGYRAPLYNFSDHTFDLLVERGFEYDASLMGDDIPYLLSSNQQELVELPSHWGCDDWPPFAHVPDLDYEMPVRAPTAGLQGFFEEFDAAYQWGGLFVPVWHPFVTGRLGRWSRVDRWLASIVEREDVWITTMANIAEYIRLLHRQGKYEPRIDTLPYYSGPVAG